MDSTTLLSAPETVSPKAASPEAVSPETVSPEAVSPEAVSEEQQSLAEERQAWDLEPFLHWGDGKVYNPLTDKTLGRGDRGWGALEAVFSNQREFGDLAVEDWQQLVDHGWVVSRQQDLSRRYLLKYVALETHTICNQSCYFCPVSLDPRKPFFMPTAMFERLVNELSAYRETLEGVFLMNYNEPTVDKRFVDQCRTLLQADLGVGVNSNGSGLTPVKVDALVEAGPLQYLSINFSTMDKERYRQERGQDQLEQVMRNLDYVKDRPVADEMVMVVLGTGDENHRKDYAQICEHFAGSRFEIKSAEVMDRAGHLDVGLKPMVSSPKLCGCDNIGSRPLQHLHITPHGKCVLCCEDYDEKYVVGDLNENSLHEVLVGDRMAQYRRWIYGLEESPDDFICKGCIFARMRQ